MCCLWIIAYALAFICTVKEKKTVIPPLASAVILPWEVIATLQATDFSYATFGKLGWSTIHFSVFIYSLFFLKKHSKKSQIFHIALFIASTIFLSYAFTLKDGRLYTSFTHTITMMIIITVYTMIKKDYPLKISNFYFAVTALLADAACLMRFNHFYENATIELLAVSLFSINIIHVIVLYLRFKKANINILYKNFNFIKPIVTINYKDKLLPFLQRYFFPQKKYYSKRKYKKNKKTKKTHRKK